MYTSIYTYMFLVYVHVCDVCTQQIYAYSANPIFSGEIILDIFSI